MARITENDTSSDSASSPMSSSSSSPSSPLPSTFAGPYGDRTNGRLATIPMEMVLEILCQCTPRDLLNLSFTNKSMNALLMSKRSAFIYARARGNVPGLPDLPPDFTERRYAAFIFLKICEFCGNRAPDRVDMPGLRLRLCSNCKDRYCITGGVASKMVHSWTLLDLIPASTQRKEGNIYVNGALLLREDVEDLVKERADITNETERMDYDKAKREEMEEIRKTIGPLSDFLRSLRPPKVDRTRAKMNELIKAVETLGYSERDLSPCYIVRDLPRELEKPLSKISWREARPILEREASRGKHVRIEREASERNMPALKALFKRIYWELPSEEDRNQFLPVLDFLCLPTVKRLLYHHPPSPAQSRMIEEALPSIKSEIQDFCWEMQEDLVKIWLSDIRCDDEAARFLKKELGRGKRPHPLSLAIILFSVMRVFGNPGRSGMIIHFSTMFQSQLLGSVSVGRNWEGLSVHPNLTEKWEAYCGLLTASGEHLVAMKYTLKALGLDWKTTTFAELQDHSGWKDKFAQILDKRQNPSDSD